MNRGRGRDTWPDDANDNLHIRGGDERRLRLDSFASRPSPGGHRSRTRNVGGAMQSERKGLHKFFMLFAFAGVGAFASPAKADSGTPGDRCAPQIANNAAAAGVCQPVCERAGLTFGGNWSNEVNHPPVKSCIAKREGQAVCGCAAKP